MTKEEAAGLLSGLEYPAREIDRHDAALKAAGLVAAYGQSDDLLEFAGAVRDEVDAYDGAEVRVDRQGVIPTYDQLVEQDADESEMEAYFKRKGGGVAVEAIWNSPDPRASWVIRTDAPHATFDIMEDGDLYCRGIVFALPA